MAGIMGIAHYARLYHFTILDLIRHSILTINAPLILKMRDIIFFLAGKLHNGPFQGIFRGGQDFFDPYIVPSAARGNFGVKNVEAPSNYPEKWPIM
jgi:hypothetical protein